jgi:excisionase family DNA binding protein
VSNNATATPWRTVEEAAARAHVSKKTIYGEVKRKRLRAARVGGRRELRLRDEWIDEWLEASVEPREISPVK